LAWFVFLGTLTVAGFGIAYGPFFAILARDAWHNTDAEINLLWAFGSLASLAGILLGRLSDHWGAKRIFILAAIGFGITTILWGIAPTWEWGLLPLLGSFFFSEAIFVTTPLPKGKRLHGNIRLAADFGPSAPSEPFEIMPVSECCVRRLCRDPAPSRTRNTHARAHSGLLEQDHHTHCKLGS
jgi:hypothetical protein